MLPCSGNVVKTFPARHFNSLEVLTETEQAGADLRRTRPLFILPKPDGFAGICYRFYRQTQALQLFNQHPEGSRDARFFDLLALDDRLVSLHPSLYVVGFNGEHFL